MRATTKSTAVGGQPWLVVDKEGLRMTLERKGKAFAIYELLQNGFDEASTKVSVTLTEPENGKSTLICVDDAPLGYADLSNAHTMFAQSKKKGDEKKRGRFNVGDKYVLALCDEATITSTTGRVIFNADHTRTHDKVRRKVGTEFRGELPLTNAEFAAMVAAVKQVIPPIPTYFNGVLIPERKISHTFNVKLTTEIADANGISRSKLRETEVRLYRPLPDEKPMLYEMGMPVVEMDCVYHVDVQQKVPLNIERDNVTPAYLKTIYTAVVNERVNELTPDEVAQPWVSTALGNKETIKPEAVKTIIHKRYGENPVLEDRKDKPSNREAASQGFTVVPIGALNNEERKTVIEIGGMKKAGQVCPTADFSKIPDKVYTRDEYTPEMKAYETFIQQIGLILLQRPVSVVFINDKRTNFQGCFQPKAKDYEMTVNLAFHEVRDWTENYYLMLHEFSHSILQSDDHLDKIFYNTVNVLAAKFVQLTLTQPNLFSPEAKAQLRPVETTLSTFTGSAFARIQREAAERSFGPETEDTIAACEHN
jgi:histidine kinase/DNA gyrase B/HSP90-like ATPase